ncbi:MAG: sulfur transferase domain-containing protein [Vicinamibacterales bacterium]
MIQTVLFRAAAVAVFAACVVLPARAQHVVGPGGTGPVPDPVNHDITGRFQAKFASVGDDMFIGGQPTEQALRDLKAQGVTTVVNLRMPEEMARIGFDEAALLKTLGITYVHLPMNGSAGNPYGAEALDRFAAVMASAQGKVLLHCTVAWRASHLWAAYLIRDRHVPVPAALAQARAINLREDAPFGSQHPVEGFLGRTLAELPRPKP